jgi:hypothetical protein
MMFTKGFVRNRAGRVVVPSNFFPSLARTRGATICCATSPPT